MKITKIQALKEYNTWAVKGNNNINYQDLENIRKFFKDSGRLLNFVEGFYYYISSDGCPLYVEKIPEGYQEISIEEFLKFFVNNEKFTLLGYDLKPEFEYLRDTLKTICKGHDFDIARSKPGTFIYEKLQEAGVINTWFDPIYTEEIKRGDHFICIDSHEWTKGEKGVAYLCKDITNDYLIYDRAHCGILKGRCKKINNPEGYKKILPSIADSDGLYDGHTISYEFATFIPESLKKLLVSMEECHITSIETESLVSIDISDIRTILKMIE